MLEGECWNGDPKFHDDLCIACRRIREKLGSGASICHGQPIPKSVYAPLFQSLRARDSRKQEDT